AVKTFHDAVAAIGDGGTLSARLAQINAAVAAYGKLTEAEKTAAKNDIDTLRAKIASYNEAVKANNKAAEAADEEALKGAGRFH
ncbi:MAG: hypothetical protein K2N74_03455, partial [Clostridiales bacterium]|nr:hypothetical protein [Clostridiales bacterium]